MGDEVAITKLHIFQVDRTKEVREGWPHSHRERNRASIRTRVLNASLHNLCGKLLTFSGHGKILNPLEEGQTQVARKQIEVYQAVRKSKMAREERMDTGEDRMEKTTLEGETIELGEERDKTIEVTKHALVGRVIAPKPLNRRTVRTIQYPKKDHGRGAMERDGLSHKLAEVGARSNNTRGLGVPPAKTLASVIAEMKQVQKGESSREKEKGEHVAMEKDKSRVSPKIGVSEYWKVKEKDMEMIEKLQWKVRRGEMTEQMELEQAAEIRHQNDIGKDIQSEKAAEEKLSGFRGDKARIKIAEAHFDTKAQILTRIDLREERIRAGLGPKHLDQLDLEPKDIGLKIPMIITESISSTCAASNEQRTNEGPIKLNYPLSQEEIRRCREVPTKENTTGRRNEMFEEENGRNLALCVWEPREKPKNDEGEYYTVELPPEDDNEGEEERKEQKKENDMEAIVITEITNRLSLKRPRKEEKNEDDGVEVNEDSLEMEDDDCRITTMKRQKAEEAGLIMPPTGAMSSIISWNCRGIRVASTVCALRELNSQKKPQIMFLIETKTRKRKVENLKRKLCFDDVFVVEAEGRSGGLAILWKKEIQVNVIHSSKNYIHAKVKDVQACHEWIFTRVYGNPNFQQHKRLWNQISRLYHPRNAPWCCVGDFNEILSQSEKEGVRLHSQNQIDVFRSFIDQNCLIDLPLKGCRFTWSNNREQGCVKEKIDRVLANRKWLNMFPNVVINAYQQSVHIILR
ncbi:hypothetical protein G2W53_006158 [Senna tora]|uniref:Endonuclease/exonuclease/phosphatase domain-containing protein n=1 Tax=Senna tora TaxID=362788 RepID=A0A835CDP3_9FABA|nr:hypothetical protein G2W53_006158 [Senna tora]